MYNNWNLCNKASVRGFIVILTYVYGTSNFVKPQTKNKDTTFLYNCLFLIFYLIILIFHFNLILIHVDVKINKIYKSYNQRLFWNVLSLFQHIKAFMNSYRCGFQKLYKHIVYKVPQTNYLKHHKHFWQDNINIHILNLPQGERFVKVRQHSIIQLNKYLMNEGLLKKKEKYGIFHLWLTVFFLPL